MLISTIIIRKKEKIKTVVTNINQDIGHGQRLTTVNKIQKDHPEENTGQETVQVKDRARP